MKKRILLLLVAMIGMATSVGWAENASADITTDLKVAQKGKPIVFSVTTKKGSEDKTVRVELKMNGETDLADWKMEYYEARQQPIGWKDWTPENGVYMYGPANGFPLIDGTSYFRMTPIKAGEYTYSLSIKEASGDAVVKTSDFNLVVSDQAATPVASIGNEDYAAIDVAVAFAANNSTINLSEGSFVLNQMLVIKKPLSIVGVSSKTTSIESSAADNWVIPTGMIESEYKHLITVLGDVTGTVTLKNLTVGNSLASGINAQSAMTTKLENVSLAVNAHAGLLVHSTVEATGLHTQQNVWGGVNVDNSNKTSYTVSFKFDATSTFEESTKIWSEITDNASIVTAPEGWTSYLGKGGSGNTTDMRYWINSKLEMEFVAEFPSNKKYTNSYFVYANGQPITVSPSKEGYIKVSVDGDADDFLEIPESNNPVIFGGSKYADVESSHITMTGGKVSMIFGGGYLGNVKNVDVAIKGGRLEGYFVGGGYGPKAKFDESKRTTADVTGKITATIENAYVRYLVSGGMEHARTEATDIKVTGDKTDILYALGGGFAPVGINQSLDTEYDAIANRTNTAKFSMDKGKISGCFYIGGGYSYSYTKDITATFNGVAVEGGMKGVGSNGRSNNVTATFTNCSFSQGENAYTPSIAAVNRGKAEQVSMNFKDCTFANEIKCYLGADANWQDGSYPVPVSGKAIFAFTGENVPVVQLSEGMQDVTLTGAVAKVDAFLQKEGVTIKTFTIPADKTWAFNNGLTIAESCTLTNNGTLGIVKEDVMAAITVGGAIQIKGSTAEAVVAEMNKAASKADLSSKDITIECSDAVIATNETKAKELIKAGKNVQLLKYSSEKGYEIGTYVKTFATITNLPDSVVYGTKPITLAFNMEGVTATITNSSDVASINEGVLTINKPGTVTLNLAVSGNEDAANTQTLKVTKKLLTVSGITATERDYDGTTAITLVTEGMKVAGLVGEDADVLNTPTGELSSKDAGDAVPVKVTATFKNNNGDYYELAEITGVTAKINKVALTVTAATPSAINFGAALPTFTATTAGFVNSETVSDLGGKLEFDCPATTTSLAGEYSVTPFGYTSQNYTIAYVAAKLKVNAIAPTAELTGVKVNSVGDNASVTVSGRVLSNGGTQTDKLLAKLEAKTGGQTTKTVDKIAVAKDGTFTADIKELTSAAYTVDLTVSVPESELASTTVSSSSIALNAKLQNIRFTTELNRLVYGSTAAIQTEGYAEGAKVEYTTSDASVLDLNEDKTEVIAKKVGSATITVTATLDQYVTAVAKQTITVEPKTLTVTPAVAPKTYDGTKAATVTYTLNGVVNEDVVTLTTATATYADQNSGTNKRITLSAPLALRGDNAANYLLVQPTDLKGTINKAGKLVVKATNVRRNYNDPVNALKYDLVVEGLIGGETLDNVLRTGAIIVTEQPDGSYTLDVSKVSFPNYGVVSSEGGSVDIIKGTPRVITVNTTDKSGVTGVLVDAEGWEGLNVEIGDGSDSKKYAFVNYGNALTSRGEELEAKEATLPTVTWSDEVSPVMNAAMKIATRASMSTELIYGDSKKISGVNGYTVESSNSNVLTVTGTSNERTVKAVGTGNAALIFTETSGGAVSSLTLKVNPKTITLTAAGTDKTYDGTTTANIQLSATGLENAALDLSGITFDYVSKDAKDNIAIYPSRTILLQGANASNYKLETASLKGKITPSALKVTSAVSKYYDGTNKLVLNTYSAEGLVAGEEVPLTATFASTNVATGITITWGELTGNYTLDKDNSPQQGNILKSTLEAILPSGASSVSDVKNKITYIIRETGAKITGQEAKTISAGVNVVKTGSNSFLVNGGDTDNYTIAYPSNSIGFKSEPVNPGTDPVSVTSVSLDKSALTLPRLESYTLTATVNPSDASNKNVTWKSSDVKIATVDANGKVTAVAVGKATITITTEDGNKTATCEVTVDFATGMEEMLADTRVYGQDHAICIEPAMPVNVLVVSLNGKLIYNDIVSSAKQIPVGVAGIYIVKLGKGNDTSVRKISVK